MAVLEIQKGEFEFADTHRWILKGNQKIVATNTITRGKIIEEIVKTRYPPYQGKPSGIPTYTISEPQIIEMESNAVAGLFRF